MASRSPARDTALTLIAALGGDSAVVGFYDYRFGVVPVGGLASSWADIRGGNALAGTSGPLVGPTGLTFDGSTSFLRNAMPGITGSHAVVMVARGTAVPDRREWELSIDSTTGVTTAVITSTPTFSSSGLALMAISQAAATVQPRIWHARRTVTVDVATRLGSGVETTSASATGAQTVTRFTLGGSRADTPALLSGLVDLRAVIVIAGVYTAAQVALVNAWAVAAHGAVLTT